MIVGDTTKVAIHVGGSSCVFFFQVLELKEAHLNQQEILKLKDGLTGSHVGNLGVSTRPPQK